MLAAAAASAALPALGSQSARFSISLAQWSLHRTFFGNALAAGFAAFGQTLRTEPESVLQGDRHPLEFAAIARNEFGIGAIEYVNTFFYGHAKDSAYLDELRRRADDNGVTSLLIMIDAVGALGAPDDATRAASIENHRPWLAAAKHLGCRAIRVNAASSGAKAEQQKLAADGLSALAAHAAIEGLDVLVENHGGWSSDGAWLAGVIRMADQPNLGTLPDFSPGRSPLDPGRGASHDPGAHRRFSVSRTHPTRTRERCGSRRADRRATLGRRGAPRTGSARAVHVARVAAARALVQLAAPLAASVDRLGTGLPAANRDGGRPRARWTGA